jgi:hypothetical protein
MSVCICTGAVSNAKAVPCGQVALDQPTVLVMGSEGKGLRTNVRTACTAFVKIAPQPGPVSDGLDSLNVSVAAGIMIHHLMSGRDVASKVAEGAEEVVNGAGEVDDGVEDVAVEVIVVADGVEEVAEGVMVVPVGVEGVAEGVIVVPDGVEEVTEGVIAVVDGVEEVAEGVEGVVQKVNLATVS